MNTSLVIHENFPIYVRSQTSKTLSVRDSADVLEFLNVKKRLRSAFPSSSSNTICSLASAASAAAAAASLSLRASSIKLCRLPTNLGDWDGTTLHFQIIYYKQRTYVKVRLNSCHRVRLIFVLFMLC